MMLRRCSHCLGLTQRLAALGLVLRVFLSKALARHGKWSQRTKSAASIDVICICVAGAGLQALAVN